jgi:tRNA(Ile2)-agmatinylcytidine synthase
VIVTGKVSSPPKTIRGGHVVFSITNGAEIDCAAYEPTKGFRNVIRQLQPSDTITVFGGVRRAPPTINIEKIKIIKLAAIHKKTENPLCPQCGKHMKSLGKNAGYRCHICRIKTSEEAATVQPIERTLTPGFYEVPVSARRHLAKPLKRMGIHKNST